MRGQRTLALGHQVTILMVALVGAWRDDFSHRTIRASNRAVVVQNFVFGEAKHTRRVHETIAGEHEVVGNTRRTLQRAEPPRMSIDRGCYGRLSSLA